MSDTDKLKEDLSRVGADLKQLVDEVRVKLHLAGQGAKDAWAELEPRLRKFEKSVEGAGQQLSQDAARLGHDLKGALEALRDKLTGEEK